MKNSNILSHFQKLYLGDPRKSRGGREFLVDRYLDLFLQVSIIKPLGLALFSLFLSACVSTSKVDSTISESAQVEDRAVVNGSVLPLPEEPILKAEPLTGDVFMSPVVKKLIATAGDQRRIGNLPNAASSLERALRIEPRNGGLWSRLAQIRYDQKAWKKAIQLAAKSNTLSGGNISLLRQNWVLMANSYDALGESEPANRFRLKLNQPRF
jgi:hypothetical protein